MICPNCKAENELTWKRYWLSPLGRHTCSHCEAKFRMAHTAKYYFSFIAIWFLISISVFYAAEYFNWSRTLSYFIYAAIGAAIIFPLDRKFDNNWRGTRLRQ